MYHKCRAFLQCVLACACSCDVYSLCHIHTPGIYTSLARLKWKKKKRTELDDHDGVVVFDEAVTLMKKQKKKTEQNDCHRHIEHHEHLHLQVLVQQDEQDTHQL